MKKLTALIGLALSWLWLCAAITDVSLSIGSTNTIIGNEITAPIICNSVSGNGIISYEMDVYYDTSRLAFIAPVKTNTLSANALLSVHEVNGVLHIAAIFTSPLAGQGTLLGLKFDTIFYGTAELGFNSALMNTTALTNLTAGVVNIANQPVDAGIAIGNYLHRANDVAEISVSVSNVALMNCTSFQLNLSYNLAVINILGVDNSGTISEDWQLSNRSSQGLLQVAGIGVNPLTTDGILLNIQIQVLATALEFSALNLSDVLFNTLSPTSVISGRMDIYNLWNLQLANEPDLQNIQNNNLLFTWNTANTSGQTLECEFQAGTDGDWTVAELFSSGWQSSYNMQELNSITPGTDVFVRLRMRLGVLVSDWLMLNGHLVPRPGSAININPTHEQQNVVLQPSLNWATGEGDPPSGYKLFFGTNNPPSNLIDNLDLGLNTSWQPSAALQYSTQYYWQIVPYNAYGNASNCPIWSFNTHGVNAIVQYPYLKNFADGAILTGGWTSTYSGSSGSNWRINSVNGVGGGYCAMVGRVSGTYWLISPTVLCPAAGGELSFAIKDFSSSPTYDIANESLDVLVSTTGTAPSAFSYSLAGLNNSAVTTAYATFTYSLSQFAGQVIYIAFRRISNSGNFVFVDNIQLTKFNPVISLSTTLLAFPATRIGQSVSASVNIANSGTGVLSGNIVYPQGYSGLASFSGNSNTIQLTYNPTVSGAYNSNLQITSSGGNAVISLQANCGEEIQTCESFASSGFIKLPSVDAWELSTVQKHSLLASWTPVTANAWLISPWMAGGSGKGLGFWGKSNSGGFIEIRYNNSGFSDLSSYQFLIAHLVSSSWTYYYIPFDAYEGQSISLLFSVDTGVWLDDFAMGAFLNPETPSVQCLLSGETLELQWLPGYNCSSYKVYQSSDLQSWDLISPPDYLECNWELSNPANRNFFRVSGINGAQ